MISDDDKICLEVAFPPWKLTITSLWLSDDCHTFVLCRHSVIGLGRTVTRNPKTLGSLSLSFPKAGSPWSYLGIFFAATALPPNGIDQRLSHCSLPLCLYAQNPLTAKLQTWTGSERSRCSALLHTAPTVSLPWPWPPGMLKGAKAKKRVRAPPWVRRSFYTAVNIRSCDKLTVLSREPVASTSCQATVAWVHLSVSLEAQLLEPRVGEACLHVRLIAPNQGEGLLLGAQRSPWGLSQFSV